MWLCFGVAPQAKLNHLCHKLADITNGEDDNSSHQPKCRDIINNLTRTTIPATSPNIGIRSWWGWQLQPSAQTSPNSLDAVRQRWLRWQVSFNCILRELAVRRHQSSICHYVVVHTQLKIHWFDILFGVTYSHFGKPCPRVIWCNGKYEKIKKIKKIKSGAFRRFFVSLASLWWFLSTPNASCRVHPTYRAFSVQFEAEMLPRCRWRRIESNTNSSTSRTPEKR